MVPGRLENLLWGSRRRSFRLVQIEPALACNLDCIMCPWSELRGGQSVMAAETFARLAPGLRAAQGVDFTGGGEPLANGRLPDMVAAAKAAGCEVGFSTNGTLLYPAVAEALIAVGVDWISFSVDAATAPTYERIRQGGDFALLERNVQALNELKRTKASKTPRLMLVFVMMRENFAELPAYVELAHRWGVAQIIVKNLDVIVNADDDRRRVFDHGGQVPAEVQWALDEAQRAAARRGIALRLYRMQPAELAVCEVNPLSSVFVSWTGDVSPCITLAYAESRVFDGEAGKSPCLRFGNITRTSLSDIWQDPAYRAFRQSYEARLDWQRRAALDALLGPGTPAIDRIPAAPLPCRTCYYLYGV